MKAIDRLLQGWRASVATKWIPDQARVLDIGCHQGELLNQICNRIGPSVGIDPLVTDQQSGHISLRAMTFVEPLPFPAGSFEAITMLAVLEHMTETDALVRECHRLLAVGGHVIITVPSRAVDTIIDGMVRFKLADGMSLEQHHGYDPADTPRLFAPPRFDVVVQRKFQLGLNNLFVFRRLPDARAVA